MFIGIDLENYESPMEEYENLVNNYGQDREIGYLKINPERIPVIVSAEKALKDIERYDDHKAVFPLKDGRYVMIADDRVAIVSDLDDAKLILTANAYLARKQGESFTALTIKEIDELIDFQCEESDVEEPADCFVAIYAFDYDEHTRCWK